MERLDFNLHDFTRLSWTSDPAREVWEPRIQRIIRAWFEIEWLAVASGLRMCSLTAATPEDFITRAANWAHHGLSGLPLEIQGINLYTYSNVPQKAEPGKPFAFRIVVGAPEHVAAFQEAYSANDDRGIGQLLGYPSCCQGFFQDVWVEQGLGDTTWSMGIASLDHRNGTHDIELSSPPETNILWRWMGVRAVSHLPCSFNCESTVVLGQQLVDLGREAGYVDEMEWLTEILSWPVEWSGLHGIAEIKTPILTAVTRTDATPSKYTLRRLGTSYPEEGAQGVVFPYQAPDRFSVSDSTSFQRGIENPIHQSEDPYYAAWYASDNGFSNRFLMTKNHAPIAEMVTATLREGGAVLDLGCGNGALLRQITEKDTDIVPFGVESEPSRLAHASLVLPEFAENFVCGSMFDCRRIWPPESLFDVILLMPGRLLEVEPEQAENLRQFIRDHSRHLIIYAYGDWLTRYGNLQGLAEAAGLVMETGDANAVVGLAGIIT